MSKETGNIYSAITDYLREFLAWIIYGSLDNFTTLHLIFGSAGVTAGLVIGKIEQVTAVYIWDPPQIVALIFSMVFFKWITGVKLDIKAGGKLDLDDLKMLTFRLMTYTFILFCANIMQKYLDVFYIKYVIVSPMVSVLFMVCLKNAADLGWVEKQVVVKVAGKINKTLGDWFENNDLKIKKPKQGKNDL